MIINLNNEHINDIFLIEKDCFFEPKSKKMIENEINNKIYTFLGYKINQKIVAYLNYSVVLDEVNIGNIGVLKEYRNKKIASKLLEKLICDNAFCDIFLEVRESNLPAINLYKKFKFKQIATRKNYYKNPSENAVIFKKEKNI